MNVVYTAEQMRAEEAHLCEYGISYETMMRNAGASIAKEILSLQPKPRDVCVFCGKGRNGGDGMVVAALLRQSGIEKVKILLMDEITDELCLKMQREAVDAGVEIFSFLKDSSKIEERLRNTDCFVDAIFGIGFHGNLPFDLSRFTFYYNRHDAIKIAIDLPSGLSCDSEKVPEHYFHADKTVALHALKIVHVFSPARKACGEITVGNIGFSPLSAPYLITADDKYLTKEWPKRKQNAHKGNFGYALCIAGSYIMPGAAALATKACVETGAGLTALAFPDAAYMPLTAKLTEPIFVPCPSDVHGFFAKGAKEFLFPQLQKANTILFGCGVGQGEGAEEILEFLIENASVPLLIDADGINLLSKNLSLLKKAKSEILLTPHLGEMSRLTHLKIEEIEENRIEIAEQFAKEYGVFLVLKGCNTVIASPKRGLPAHINYTGNPGMATGGSGDMLSGIILSLLAQGVPPEFASIYGVYIHGVSGDMAAKEYSQMGTTPTRMLEKLPEVLLRIEQLCD